ncbi:RES domain-containing protein [Ensifer adhaerens]|nr:RES domain-containing protein [Ensifer adhaerens]
MMPLPGPLGSGKIIGWRLDHKRFSERWDSGEGAFLFGGRWNSKGNRVVYASLDPSTAILEVAVHKGFKALDTVPHVLTAFEISDPADVKSVSHADVPNPNWLHPAIPSAGQQHFGDTLTSGHLFVVIPSVVSSMAWNVVFNPQKAAGRYRLLHQQDFALDPRLHPAI